MMQLELRAPAAGRVEVVEGPCCDPAHGEVRVAVQRCGICGSDLHWFLGRQMLPPVCPGHEMSGIVDAVGAGVSGVREGDRVTVEPLVRCGECTLCRRGDYHLCARLQIPGLTAPGGMASSLVVPAYSLFTLPDSIDFELGALAEPTAVTVHALRLANVGSGSRVLILGAGTIGLLTAAAARHLGAEHVSITARHEHQREAALRLGCDEVLTPDSACDVSGHPGAVIETVGGTASTLDDAVSVVARGGSVIVVGLFEQPPAFNPLTFIMKEVRIVGSMVYNRKAGRADFDIALEILTDHRSQLRPLVTHVVPLKDAQVAFETAADKKSGAVKVMLDPTA